MHLRFHAGNPSQKYAVAKASAPPRNLATGGRRVCLVRLCCAERQGVEGEELSMENVQKSVNLTACIGVSFLQESQASELLENVEIIPVQQYMLLERPTLRRGSVQSLVEGLPAAKWYETEGIAPGSMKDVGTDENPAGSRCPVRIPHPYSSHMSTMPPHLG